MEAAIFAPHQVAILELLAVEAEATAATAPGRMAANGMSSISKGGAVMRRSATLGGIESDHGSLIIL
uniref:Uncharacterized protein n=1 Tax=Oryza sativa subsp. japonica TaxID=39947 RepID=Q6YXV5_ORYSJ|nr:hypothetical protein [Oryza sativa Japonica Group]